MPSDNVNEPNKGGTKASFIVAAIRCDAESMSSVISDRLESKTVIVSGIQALREDIHSGFPENCRLCDTALNNWHYQHSLHETDSDL